jgi:predicted DCC family thiol-disulfide oxidoreductase YuxK
MDERGQPLLIFDGDCAFCTSSAIWIAEGWRGSATALPWQQLGGTGLSELGLSVDDCREYAWWVEEPSGELYKGHRAIAKALRANRGWKRFLGGLILTPVFDPIAAQVYRLIARNRYRLPGGSPACRVPAPNDSALSDRADLTVETPQSKDAVDEGSQ